MRGETLAAGEAGQGDAGGLSPFAGRGLYVILLLALVNVVNFVDRQMPFILIGSIKADLKLTDTQIGLMAGLAFAIVYSFAGLPLARLADRWSPRKVLALSLTIWSLATALTGFAQNFLHMVCSRVAVAGAEAGSTPTGHALIARAYAADRRAIALAIFSCGVPIGTTVGLALGGLINDLANWRVAFFIVGGPGLLLALLAWLTLPEADRTSVPGAASVSYRADIRQLFAMHSFRNMAAASSLYAIGSYAMNVFGPSFLIRVHGLSTTKAGLGFGIAFGLGGAIGTYAGGWLGDRLGRHDVRWRQWVPAIGQFASIPITLGAWLVANTRLSIALLTLTYMLHLLYFACTFATAQMLVPERMRATASAVLLFCLTLLGSSVGPVVIGWVSDALAPTYGNLSLRYAMCLMAITIAWSGWHFHRAALALPQDFARVAERPERA
jgi:predicted MFS family arabinose efflux permease